MPMTIPAPRSLDTHRLAAYTAAAPDTPNATPAASIAATPAASTVREPAPPYAAGAEAGPDAAPINRHTDPMRPPTTARPVRCLRCDATYCSSAMHWVDEVPTELELQRRAEIEDELCALFGGRPREPHPDDEDGRWRCATDGCAGAGYLFDIHPC